MREYYITLLSVGIAVGSFIGPLIGGLLLDMFNYAYTFLLLGILSLVVLPLTFLFKSGRSVLPKQEAAPSNSFYLLSIPDLRKAIIVSSVILLARDTYTAFFPLLAADQRDFKYGYWCNCCIECRSRYVNSKHFAMAYSSF